MNSNRKRPSTPLVPIDDGSFAGGPRRQKKAMIASSTWELLLPVPVSIETFSWLDQENLMNLSLVSKKFNGIIAVVIRKQRPQRRRQRKARIASFWNLLLPVPVIHETISWLDQESLMNLCLVSKKFYDIIAGNEPGNKNKIIPVFEVIGKTSLETLLKNLRVHFRNKETRSKLQSYVIMRFKDLDNFEFDYTSESIMKNIRIAKKVQMNGITSLDLSSGSLTTIEPSTSALFSMLPNLRQVDMSNKYISRHCIHTELFRSCPSLEKLTMHNSADFCLSAFGMGFTSSIKEIYIDNSYFDAYENDELVHMADLNDHQDTFMFHYCCNALERVSIRNMNLDLIYNDGEQFAFNQNACIKFIRNAPQTLRWFRSDLTQENMEMLRKERPGIELLN
ncbi:hypothetical protein FRACYDRAFT_244160 [Fragilariopsis cylindrus CCMP1102]|uniref:F-box domain-containing protein n=1 Tax=Fragilariopsis cylindrus CCMP1102 TaxID=635003 RepID=A0A1E7F426_9STRA|nr:hypothetical protein FRACYDRAFT_244160 [Fragilariopsis cylindrus CCMP1102]|eukprot:OEU12886.1 hypothetical protein FRACYDRAFT_244160 [Fragilariopsis cylindrus CCMP1102]